MNILKQSQFEVSNSNSDTGGKQFRRSLAEFDLLGAVRRQALIIIAGAGFGAILGLVFVSQATPIYTSAASILIDAKNVGMAATTALEGSLAFESGAVDSQVQIINSDKLAASVARRLNLQNNLMFLDPPPSPLGEVMQFGRSVVGSIKNVISQSTPPLDMEQLPEDVRLLFASKKLQANLKVTRIGRTYVFSIEYSDADPSLAQAITGQYVNAYLEDQLDSKFDATRRATSWMEERIRDLRTRSLAADEAVQRYRADNNLVEASGRLVDEQALTDATTQLALARSERDAASARYQRLNEIINEKDATGSMSQTLGSANVAQLRSKYLEASKLFSDMVSRYGATHNVAIKAQKDMAEYQRLIFEELKNLLPGYQSDVSISQSRVDSIQNTISELRNRAISNDSAMVKLRALEQESESLKVLYSTFLQKSQELQQQQSFPVTDARIISEPSIPIEPSGPRKILYLMAFLFLGGAVGTSVAGVREWRDRGIRTATQVRDELGLEFLANIPVLDTLASNSITQTAARGSNEVNGGTRPFLTVRSEVSALREVVDRPMSQFSEAIRAIKINVDLDLANGKGLVIGLASMFPDEGKSTTAKNLASSLAFQGTKTILIDGDLRNPSLTRSLVGQPKRGLVDAIEDRVQLADLLAFEEGSGLAFLPGATRSQQGNDLYSNPRTHHFIEKLKQRFDVIIIDFPPVAALTDAIAAAGIVDGYVFVAHWGRTPRRSLQEFFENNPRFSDKTLGVALNKVDMRRLERYGSALGGASYGKYSDKYFPKVHA
jgi:polysaccharide biosynthesis transport protein